jgi:hypothetical protein
MKYCFFTSIFLFSPYLFSQDLIIKNNGEKIEAKVNEISTTLIRYRNFSQPNGPDRSIEISKVKEIIYEDGQFEKFDHRVIDEIDDTLKFKSTVQNTPPLTPEDELKNHLRKDPIMKSGLAFEGVFGATISPSSLTYISLNLEISNKWYFNKNNQWRTGLQVNWIRFGNNIASNNNIDNNSGPILFGPIFFSPLNLGWTNVLRVKETMGVEANITGGVAVASDSNEGSLLEDLIIGGFSISPEVKFRLKKMSFGLDYMIFIDGNKGRAWNTIGLSFGVKL